MVILVSNIAIDHCHQSVTKGYREKKRTTVVSSTPTSIFASLEIFGHASAFVSTSPPAFFLFCSYIF